MIHDVELKDLQINADERGELTEIWRSDWDFYDGDDTPEMSYFSVSYPGVIRVWHRHHRGQVDHFVTPHGKIKVGIYDNRSDSPTEGELDTYVVDDGNIKAVRVPGSCWHGFKVIGDERATLINFPIRL